MSADGATRGVIVGMSAFLAATNATVRVRVLVGACIFGLYYMALSEARRQGFSSGTPGSSPPLSVNGSANKIKLKQMRFKLCQT